jgi:hypothetical protein
MDRRGSIAFDDPGDDGEGGRADGTIDVRRPTEDADFGGGFRDRPACGAGSGANVGGGTNARRAML